METKEKYTISEATKLLGFKSRSTLNKRTKATGSDSISCETDENGTKVIALVELQRVFPDRVKIALTNSPDTPTTYIKHSTKAQERTPKNTADSMWLGQKLDILNEQLEQEKSERLRERREAQERDTKSENREHILQQQITELTKTLSQQTLLLEDKRESKESVSKNTNSIASELIKVFQFAAIAALIITFLVLIVFFMG